MNAHLKFKRIFFDLAQRQNSQVLNYAPRWGSTSRQNGEAAPSSSVVGISTSSHASTSSNLTRTLKTGAVTTCPLSRCPDGTKAQARQESPSDVNAVADISQSQERRLTFDSRLGVSPDPPIGPLQSIRSELRSESSRLQERQGIPFSVLFSRLAPFQSSALQYFDQHPHLAAESLIAAPSLPDQLSAVIHETDDIDGYDGDQQQHAAISIHSEIGFVSNWSNISGVSGPFKGPASLLAVDDASIGSATAVKPQCIKQSSSTQETIAAFSSDEEFRSDTTALSDCASSQPSGSSLREVALKVAFVKSQRRRSFSGSVVRRSTGTRVPSFLRNVSPFGDPGNKRGGHTSSRPLMAKKRANQQGNDDCATWSHAQEGETSDNAEQQLCHRTLRRHPLHESEQQSHNISSYFTPLNMSEERESSYIVQVSKSEEETRGAKSVRCKAAETFTAHDDLPKNRIEPAHRNDIDARRSRMTGSQETNVLVQSFVRKRLDELSNLASQELQCILSLPPASLHDMLSGHAAVPRVLRDSGFFFAFLEYLNPYHPCLDARTSY